MATGIVLVIVGLAVLLRAITGKLPDQLVRALEPDTTPATPGWADQPVDAHDRAEADRPKPITEGEPERAAWDELDDQALDEALAEAFAE